MYNQNEMSPSSDFPLHKQGQYQMYNENKGKSSSQLYIVPSLAKP